MLLWPVYWLPITIPPPSSSPVLQFASAGLTPPSPQRWHGYCHSCLPRVSTSLIQQLSGQYQVCTCVRSDAAKRYRKRWLCAGCFEAECVDIVGLKFEDKKCKGRGCGKTVAEVGWERFQPVCGWCLRVVDEKGMEVAREAVREGEGFEILSSRKDSRRS